MARRRVRIVLLCEDSQHEAFVRRFLKGMGWDTREMRVLKSPRADGSAEQWVRENFPVELRIYRQRNTKAVSALVAVMDADTRTVDDRLNELETECRTKGVEFRKNSEAVVVAIPKRNIETWIHYLDGHEVNEDIVYPKLNKAGACTSAVNHLLQRCRSTGLGQDAPPSLARSCNEYTDRIARLVGMG